jgi:hypothetical protein
MRLFDDYIKRRPLMERDGSGVSALLGLDGLTQRGGRGSRVGGVGQLA